MRKIFFALGLVALFAVGPIVSHADDGARLVALTASRITAALGTGSTAQTNLGFGTAALQNTGTSGANVPLLNVANTWGAAQTMAGLAISGSNLITLNGVNFAFNNGSFNILYDNAGNQDILLGSGNNLYSNTNHIFRNSAGSVTFATINANGLQLPKLASAPSTAPGAGLTYLYFVAGTTGGTCKLQAMAGTSTTPVTVTDNIGSGC